MNMFSSEFKGKLLTPTDTGYDEARKLWNGMVDKRPALIAQCTTTSDVVIAVNHARTNGLVVAVRGGGHNVAGNASCDGGIVIDLRPMKTVSVDPEGVLSIYSAEPESGQFQSATVTAVTVSARIVIFGESVESQRAVSLIESC